MPNDIPSAKRALLIGIDQYALQPDVVRPLSGCGNDVDLMRSILVDTYAFDPANVAVVKDAAATHDGIVAAFEQLIATTSTSDIVVIQYSGHGSQRWNTADEEWDSTIVPVDSGREDKPNRDISDKDINDWLRRLGERTPFTTLFFDSCHSGTITRDVFEAVARSVPPDTRGVPPNAPTRRGVGGAGPSPALGDTYVVISGCRDEEESWEYKSAEGVKHGALTYFLAQELQKAGPSRSCRAVFEAVAPLVTAYKGQHPQIEGVADRVMLGTETVTPMAYVMVNGPSADGTGIELAAGAGHRVTVGSEYDVYAPGTDTLGDTAATLGRVRVSAVRVVTSDATPLGSTAAATFPVGARAVEAAHAYGSFRMTVLLDASVTTSAAPEVQAFVQAVRRSRKLEVLTAAGDRPPGVVVHLVAPRSAVAPNDVVPQLGAVAAPTWVTTDGAGRPVAPIKALGDHADVAANLDTLANLRDTLALDNTDPNSALRGKVRLDLFRRVPGADAPATMDPKDFQWARAQPDANGRIVFNEGETIGFEIINDHTEPVFVNLLTLGFGGDIGVIFPRGQDGTPWLAAKSDPQNPYYTVVRRWDHRGFGIRFPKSYPFVATGNPVDDDEGTDTLKLIVTTHEARFDAVAQAAMRDIPAAQAPKREPSAIESLLNRAYDAKPATRDLDFGDPPPATVPVHAEDWTTVTRRFVTRRAGSTPPVDAGGRASGIV